MSRKKIKELSELKEEELLIKMGFKLIDPELTAKEEEKIMEDVVPVWKELDKYSFTTSEFREAFGSDL